MSVGRLIGRPSRLVVTAALAVGLAALACGGGEPEAVDEADMERLEAMRGAEFGSVAEHKAEFDADLFPEGEKEAEAEGSEAGVTTVKIISSTHPDVTVSVGSVVEWQNEDAVAHTTTAGTPGEPSALWASGSIEPGSDFTFKFEGAGEYKYFCSIHNFMTATVTVTE